MLSGKLHTSYSLEKNICGSVDIYFNTNTRKYFGEEANNVILTCGYVFLLAKEIKEKLLKSGFKVCRIPYFLLAVAKLSPARSFFCLGSCKGK